MRLNAMLEKVPGIESTFYEREQVQREREREGKGVENREEKRSAKETRAKEGGERRVGKGCFVISWRVRGFRHVCLITFQSTRQSATPLSASHHPENYSFILEQLGLPMYRDVRSLSFSLSLFTSSSSRFRFTLFSCLRPEKSILTRPVRSRVRFFRLHLVALPNPARLFRSIRPLTVVNSAHPAPGNR